MGCAAVAQDTIPPKKAPQDSSVPTKKKKRAVDIRLGAGILSAPVMVEGLSNELFTSIVTPGHTNTDLSGSITFMMCVLFFPDNRINFGIDLVYDRIEAAYTYPDSTKENVEATYFSIMPRADLKYLKRKGLQLYGSLGAGLAWRDAENTTTKTAEENKIGIAFHITPIGIRLGNKFAFWAELGFGFRGFICGGLSYKF